MTRSVYRNAMESGGRQPLSGRRRELAVIADAVTRANQGLATTIALVGEPGIGKTRLATEGATTAAGAGFATLWGRGWEAGGAPAYWPWRQLCDRLPRDSIGALWGARGDGSLDPDHARFELFDAVTRAIATRAADGPIVCILDDLHVADVPSLELIAFATRHLRSSRVVWLLTWRDVEGARAPVRDQLVRISREATVLSLGALSEVDANALIDHAHAHADVALRTRIVHATGGNPLFLLETLAAFATGRALPTDQLPLAEGIAALVRDRLAPVSAEARALGEAASVIGRDVALARWAVASAMPAESVHRGARELVGAGVLVTSGTDRWRFGHDLVREAIYRSMEHPQIVHRRLADALDREIRAGASALVGERAHHALHTGDVANIVPWTIAASEHARHQCACEEAIAILERAAPWLGTIAQRDAAFQLARGRAYLDHGDVSRATEAFSTAIALARKSDDPPMFAAAVLGLGARYVFGDLLHDLVALIDEALAILPPEHHELAARLLARKAAALTPADDPAPVLEMAREALRLVSDSSDDAARLEVAAAAGAALTDFAPPRECAAVNETMIALARARGERALELRGLSRLVANYLQTG
jgi:predicted ATPase